MRDALTENNSEADDPETLSRSRNAQANFQAVVRVERMLLRAGEY